MHANLAKLRLVRAFSDYFRYSRYRCVASVFSLQQCSESWHLFDCRNKTRQRDDDLRHLAGSSVLGENQTMGKKPPTIEQLCEQVRKLRQEQPAHETFEQQKDRRERLARLDREISSRYAWLNRTIDNYCRMSRNAAFDPFLNDLLEQRKRCRGVLKEVNAGRGGFGSWQWAGFRKAYARN